MSSYLDYKSDQTPTGWRKILYLNWPLVFLIAAVASIGFLMLVSVAGGRIDTWAEALPWLNARLDELSHNQGEPA